jgi:type I restriction enzyme, S subunit
MASWPRRPTMSSKASAGIATFRFDQMSTLINDRVDNPAESGVERYVGLEHLDADSLRITRWGEITDVESTKLRFQPGDIIFGKRRVYQRKLAVADFEGICSAHAMVLRAKPKVMLPEFLPFFMQSDRFMERALAISVGSLSPTINWTTLAAEEFALPPIEEQRRMVSALGAAVAALDSLVGLRGWLIGLELSYLRSTFGNSYDEPPQAVPRIALAEIAEVRTGLAKGRKSDHSTTTRPYLRVANVKDGHLDLAEMKEIVVERNRIDRYVLHRGDVLMTEGGDLDKLGRGTVWQDEVPGCLHQNHVFAVRVDQATVDPWYLAAVARSPYGRSYFLRCAKRSSNLASVNKQQVSAFRIPMLARHLQADWTRVYKALREQQAATECRINSIRALISSVLDESDIVDVH